jgi:hypothetical protein
MLIDNLRDARAAAMRGDRQNLNIIRYLIGQMEQAKTQPCPDEHGYSIIKGLCADGPSTITEQDRTFLRSLLPVELTVNEMAAALNAEVIRSAPDQGRAINLAMQQVRSAYPGRTFSGSVVANLVKDARKEIA